MRKRFTSLFIFHERGATLRVLYGAYLTGLLRYLGYTLGHGFFSALPYSAPVFSPNQIGLSLHCLQIGQDGPRKMIASPLWGAAF